MCIILLVYSVNFNSLLLRFCYCCWCCVIHALNSNLIVGGWGGAKSGVLQPLAEWTNISVDGWILAVASLWYTWNQSIQNIGVANFAYQTSAGIAAADSGQSVIVVIVVSGERTTEAWEETASVVYFNWCIFIFLVFFFALFTLYAQILRLSSWWCWWRLVLQAQLMTMQLAAEKLLARSAVNNHLTGNHQVVTDCVWLVGDETETGHKADIATEKASARDRHWGAQTFIDHLPLAECDDGQIVLQCLLIKVTVDESATST